MFETLIYKVLKEIPIIADKTAVYNNAPSVFYQQLPNDMDCKWNEIEMFPRIIYSIDWQSNPERKIDGSMAVDIFCTNENSIAPEDIAANIVTELSGLFLTDTNETYCAVWNSTDGFDVIESEPIVSGVTVSFDVLQFPKQEGIVPCPVWSVNQFIKEKQPDCVMIGHDKIAEKLRATRDNPVIYVRKTDTRLEPKMSTFAMAWMQTDINISIISSSVETTRQWTAMIQRELSMEQETIMQNGSPYLIMKMIESSSNEPLKTGQLLLTGQYGIMRKMKDTTKLNNVYFKKEG